MVVTEKLTKNTCASENYFSRKMNLNPMIHNVQLESGIIPVSDNSQK